MSSNNTASPIGSTHVEERLSNTQEGIRLYAEGVRTSARFEKGEAKQTGRMKKRKTNACDVGDTSRYVVVWHQVVGWGGADVGKFEKGEAKQTGRAKNKQEDKFMRCKSHELVRDQTPSKNTHEDIRLYAAECERQKRHESDSTVRGKRAKTAKSRYSKFRLDCPACASASYIPVVENPKEIRYCRGTAHNISLANPEPFGPPMEKPHPLVTRP